MKLHEHVPPHINLVGCYGAGGVEVNGRLLTRPLILTPGFLVENWIDDATGLTPECLAPIWAQEPRILLLGGAGFATDQLKALRRMLTAREVALEVMDVGAACRTYNVLAQEERPVAALLFP